MNNLINRFKLTNKNNQNYTITFQFINKLTSKNKMQNTYQLENNSKLMILKMISK